MAVDSISSLSSGEYALIAANHKIAYEKKFQCGECLKKATREIRTEKGCFDSSRRRYQIEGFGYTTCLGNLTSPAVFHWFGLYRGYKTGIFPFPGSALDQPSKAMEIFQAFDFLEMKRAEEEERLRKLAERDNK